MLKIPINKAMDEYKADVYKGLTLREVIFGSIALIVTVVIVLGLYWIYNMPLQLAVYMAIPFSGIIGLCGFYKKNGMYFSEILIRYINITIKYANTLPYISEEIEEYKEVVSELDS